MRLLFFVDTINRTSGVERMAVSLANELCARGFAIDIVVCGLDTKSSYSLDDRIGVHALGCLFHDRLRAVMRFWALVKVVRPDVIVNVMVSMGQISLPALMFLPKCPKIVTWEHFHLHAGSRLGYLFRLFSAWISDKTVVLTDRDKKAYPRMFLGKIERIYNFTVFKPGYLTREDKRIALSVGRLEDQKGYDLLLPIWKRVSGMVEGWRLRIVGDGRLEKVLKAQAEDLGITDVVEFIPANPDVMNYYRESSVYVMSSRFEGLPMVLIEAKACGLACISFDCPNGPDEIIRDEKDGYVVPFGDLEQFVQKFLLLLSSERLREMFGHDAVKDIQDRFLPERIVKEWEILLKKIRR